MSTTASEQSRGAAFAELHEGPGAFVIANVWDAGTARALSGLGFAALATTSGGLAQSLGRKDRSGQVTREDTLRNARDIVDATHLPVSADLENGFGDSPEEVVETIRRAAEIGLAGGSIEDATGDPGSPIYDFEHAVERVAAAAEAAKAQQQPFVLTARAENFLHGLADLDDTIRRLRAYEEAGADVLFAPLLPDADAIRAVCESVSRPVNVLALGAASQMSVQELAELGVRRISLGGELTRVAVTAVTKAAKQILESGTLNVS